MKVAASQCYRKISAELRSEKDLSFAGFSYESETTIKYFSLEQSFGKEYEAIDFAGFGGRFVRQKHLEDAKAFLFRFCASKMKGLFSQ